MSAQQQSTKSDEKTAACVCDTFTLSQNNKSQRESWHQYTKRHTKLDVLDSKFTRRHTVSTNLFGLLHRKEGSYVYKNERLRLRCFFQFFLLRCRLRKWMPQVWRISIQEWIVCVRFEFEMNCRFSWNSSTRKRDASVIGDTCTCFGGKRKGACRARISDVSSIFVVNNSASQRNINGNFGNQRSFLQLSAVGIWESVKVEKFRVWWYKKK